MERASYRLRYAGVFIVLCAAGVFLAVLAMADRHPPAAEKGPILATIVAFGVLAGLLLPRIGVTVLVASTAVVFVLGQALSAAILAATEWSILSARLIAAALTIAVILLLGRVRLREVATDHGEVVDAPIAEVWRTLLPSPEGRYWKPTMRVTPVPGRPDEFDFRILSLGETAEPSRIRLEILEPGRQARFLILDEKGAVQGRQTHFLEERDGRTLVGARFELRRPTLFFLVAHAVLDLPSDELRRLKAHIEGRSCAGWGASL